MFLWRHPHQLSQPAMATKVGYARDTFSGLASISAPNKHDQMYVDFVLRIV